MPHLMPYSTVNFAAVGFSEGLRAELGRGAVTVTTVVWPWGRSRAAGRVLFKFAETELLPALRDP